MTRALVVTGASQGIGRATAELFRNHHCPVLNISRRPCTVPGVENIGADMSVPGWIDSARERVADFLSGHSMIALLHNAAVLRNDRLGAVDPVAFRTAIELNVTAAIELNQLVLPKITPGSAIIYIGSTLSEKAVAGALSYVTTKHAVIGLMRSSCQDLAGTGIHTACVCPGFTDTQMLRSHLPDAAVRQQIAARNAFGRLIEPAEIAAVIKFCAENPVVNGAVIHANLGQLEG